MTIIYAHHCHNWFSYWVDTNDANRASMCDCSERDQLLNGNYGEYYHES